MPSATPTPVAGGVVRVRFQVDAGRSRSRSRTRATEAIASPNGGEPASGALVESGMGLAIIRAIVDELEIEGPVDGVGNHRSDAQAARPQLGEGASALERGVPGRADARAPESSPVISKIRRADVSGRTTIISPPASRARRSAPIIVPRAVESRNSTAVRSSTSRGARTLPSCPRARRRTDHAGRGASCASSSPAQRHDR